MAGCIVVGAILFENTAILLGKRADMRTAYPGVWDVFGGHVEQHEAPEQALVRELQEELGITPVAFVEVAVIEVGAVDDSHADPTERCEFHLYHVTQWTGKPENLLLEEHSEIRWVPLADVAALEIASPAYLPLFHRLASIGVT